MLRVDLEDRLRVRHFLPAGLEDLAHLQAKVLFADGEDRRRIGQAVGNADFADLLVEHLLQALDQAFLALGDFFLGLLVLFRVQAAQVQVAAGDIDELLAVELRQVAHQPLVDAIGEQQHLDALLAEDFQVRAVLHLRVALAGEVVDLVLAFLHPTDVVGQRYALLARIVAGGGEAQQAGDLLLVAEVFRRAFLEDLAEVLPEGLVLLRLVLRQLLQHVQHALGQRRLHRVDHRILLQDFPGDVQRQVVGVDHTLDEAQVQRQELVGLVHDEHALYVQLQAPRRFAMVQVERRAARHVEQRGVFQLAFDLVVAPAQRVLEVMGDVLVELLVFLVLHLGARTGPQRAGAVDRFPFRLGRLVGLFAVEFLGQLDRQSDVIGVFLDHVAQAPAIGELLLALFQVKDDAGTALGLVDGSDVELALALRRPVHPFAGRLAGATGVDIDLVGDDEGAVETDAELADQVRILLLVARQVLQEVGGPGLGDGAQVSHHILAAHADAVVFQGDGVGFLVEADADLQLGAALEQLGIGQGFETQLVGGVRGVGNQFAEEDFLVRIERMNHQVKQLLHFSLKAQCLFLGFHAHRSKLHQ